MFIKFFPSLFFSPSQIKSACSVIWPSFSWNNSHPKWSLTDVTFGPPPAIRHAASCAVNHQPRHRSLTWVKVTFWMFFFTLKKTNALVPHAATDSFYIPRSPFSRLRNVCNGNHSPCGTSARVFFLGNGPLGTLTNRWSESEINENYQ